MSQEMSVSRPFALEIEAPLDLAKMHEVTLLRQAVAANPASIDLRFTLAMRLFQLDAFDDVIALLEALFAETTDADVAWHLAEAYITRETPQGDERSEYFARASLALAVTPMQRAGSLATLGKTLTRQGRTAEARTALTAALDADPHDRNAYKRLATLDVRAGESCEALDLADRLIARGVGHSRVLGARTIALARLGRIDDAREADGFDRFLDSRILATPAGWDDIAALNRAVRAELDRHPDLRFDRYGTASSKTWRIDQPAFATSTAISVLQSAIRSAVIDRVAALDAHDTPWTNARPERAVLHNWVVLTDAEGYEEWHVHQNGWLSGVYYVEVPVAVRQGEDRAGCIAFGLPEEQVGFGPARAFGETLIRPQPGMLMLFPSHCHHRTFAHGSDQRRICLAFDIQHA